MIRVGVLTVSDSSARGEREDLGGPAVAAAAEALGWRVERTSVVPDEVKSIEAALREWSDGAEAVDIVLTTGGTGLSPRDVTPEATRAAADREIPGLAERIRRIGETHTPRAVLSRGTCGSRNSTLFVNLPGSPKGAVESLEAVAGVLPHALEMMRGGGHASGG